MSKYIFSMRNIILLVLLLLCTSAGTAYGTQSIPSVGIQIGVLADYTGPSSSHSYRIVQALEDMVNHYNDNNFCLLEVIGYDTRYDSDEIIPGYEWLKEKGADLIFTTMPQVAETLEQKLKEDGIILFTVQPVQQGKSSDSNIFNFGPDPKVEVNILLEWIAENDWDYKTKGPARIGGAGWVDFYYDSVHNAIQQYCEMHPNQFEFVGGYLTDNTFVWDDEVESLKDCDYVIPPSLPVMSFIQQYRREGHQAQFIGTYAHISLQLPYAEKKDFWNDIDGMLVTLPFRWWNEESDVITFTKNLFTKNHSYDVEGIDAIEASSGYLTTVYVHVMLEIIVETVQKTSYEDFNSNSLYETATSFSTYVDSCPHSFSVVKRTSNDALGIYRVNGEEKDLFRIVPDWIPLYEVTSPVHSDTTFEKSPMDTTQISDASLEEHGVGDDENQSDNKNTLIIVVLVLSAVLCSVIVATFVHKYK